MCHVLVLYDTAIYRNDILKAQALYVTDARGIYRGNTPIYVRQRFHGVKSVRPAYTKS